MNRHKTTLLISLLTLGLFFVFAPGAHAEVIKNFDAQITVNKDASVLVVETILYDAEGVAKHGIYRDITPESSTDEPMTIRDISITDTFGVPYKWQRQINNGDVRLKIGDPDKTFVGQKTYVIRYVANNAIGYLDQYDELFWNITGNAWPFVIEQSKGTVFLPDKTSVLQAACYQGIIGSNERCITTGTTFSATRSLQAGEGLTVAVGFPKGIVVPYVPTTKDAIMDFIGLWWPALIPLCTFIYMFRKWYRKGRDAKGRGIIIPEYEVIDNLTPIEAAVIMTQTFNGRAVIAQILSLAVRGYISITQTEEKKFLGKKINYTLTLTKSIDESLQSFDKVLLTEIFHSNTEVGTSVLLSSNNSLYAIHGSLADMLKERIVKEGYYTKDFVEPTSSLYRKLAVSVGYLVFIVLLYVVAVYTPIGDQILRFVGNLLVTLFIGEFSHIVFAISLVGSFYLTFFFKSIMPAKTTKGAYTREHLLGLKEYIRVAEKDRIAFHNAPEAKPALFDTLLPYAVLFGLEKKWVKAFDGITLSQPKWYSSSHGTFVPAVFISDFSDSFSSSFFDAPSSGSGSGGGGFSGGGGGGGGGGSW